MRLSTVAVLILVLIASPAVGLKSRGVPDVLPDHRYVGHTDCPLTDSCVVSKYSATCFLELVCVPIACEGILDPVAGTCFVLEIEPNEEGQGFVSVTDDVMFLVAGFACQDHDSDMLCGEPGDYGQRFCADVVLDPAAGWDYGRVTWIFVGGLAMAQDQCWGYPVYGTTGTMRAY